MRRSKVHSRAVCCEQMSWETPEGGGIELWLPESYDGDNLAEDL